MFNNFFEYLREVVTWTIALQIIGTVIVYLFVSIVVWCLMILQQDFSWIDTTIIYWTAWRVHIVLAIGLHICGWIYLYLEDIGL
jgi:hypothetical protein